MSELVDTYWIIAKPEDSDRYWVFGKLEVDLCDRQLAQTIAGMLRTPSTGLARTQILRNLREHREEIASHVAEYYPAYFSRVFGQLVVGADE